MAEVIDDFLRLTVEEVRRFGGRVTQFRGDGFIALFGGPVADEDHAHRAALAAWAILSRLEERAGEDAGGRGDLEVRVGAEHGRGGRRRHAGARRRAAGHRRAGVGLPQRHHPARRPRWREHPAGGHPRGEGPARDARPSTGRRSAAPAGVGRRGRAEAIDPATPAGRTWRASARRSPPSSAPSTARFVSTTSCRRPSRTSSGSAAASPSLSAMASSRSSARRSRTRIMRTGPRSRPGRSSRAGRARARGAFARCGWA